MSEENIVENEVIENVAETEVIENSSELNSENVSEKPVVEEVYRPWKAEKKLPESIPYTRFSETVAERNAEREINRKLQEELAQYRKLQEATKEITDYKDINLDTLPIDDLPSTIGQIAERKAYERFQKEQEARVQMETQVRKVQDFSGRMEKAILEQPELREASKHVGTYIDQIPSYIQDSIIEDENGPWILWEMATQKGLIEELSRLNGVDALRKLGRISAKYDNRNFNKEAQKEVVKDIPTYEPKASGTPSSPRVSDTGSGAIRYKNTGDLSEYKAWRKSQK